MVANANASANSTSHPVRVNFFGQAGVEILLHVSYYTGHNLTTNPPDLTTQLPILLLGTASYYPTSKTSLPHLQLVIPADLIKPRFTLSTIHQPIHNSQLPTPITTVRQRRLAESKTHAANNKTSRKRARIDDEYVEDTEEDEDDHETSGSGNEHENTDTASDAIPNINNYRAIGMEWGLARAEQYLASLKLPKNNRPSGTGLYEAQSLQSIYELDKTMLCIVLKVSRRVLDEALNVATSTPMPSKGVSQGFPERNRIVGSTWSTYIDEEQEVFTPRLFERLCVATHEAYALTQTPLGISTSTAVQDTSIGTSTKSGLEPLTQDELAKYVPVFERLVNLKKVSQDLHLGRLWRHSGKSSNRTSEQLMKQEIASWNPATTTAQALFQDEHTSCDRWARLQKKNHLLERFTFESTKAPHHLRKTHEPKPQSASAARQAEKRSELARNLNDLIVPYLRGGYQGKGDAHPKCPELTEAFAKKTFRGDVALTFHRTPDSQVTDMMISKGPSCLTNDEVDAWIEDINSKNYTIVRVKKTKKHENIAEEECNSNSSKCDSSLDSVNAQILAELTGPHQAS
ncbi:uncharacterized protein MELLADRAFT_66339 [Melampsora larici-populina 98AG31]|uniref:Uncharacterized protein n=1 Tax=Melampsora larici-populina (strain 98AG31 / pathotype 3-4-7) TaxID=747676 RepID=F4RYS9_MELLP|nr:uncharacterized protein MELLADRAFT_66339 [Melampsora larici-populina 98AG31]EGG02522.1 hypothetical protein MELLADRAFT_66339 [Melampsora larici-populina 98AG31]